MPRIDGLGRADLGTCRNVVARPIDSIERGESRRTQCERRAVGERGVGVAGPRADQGEIIVEVVPGDKDALRDHIIALRGQGLSYREIAQEIGLHWTRVGQILNSTGFPPDDKPS